MAICGIFSRRSLYIILLFVNFILYNLYITKIHDKIMYIYIHALLFIEKAGC